jgi:NADH-quinone oxidoreductase subunit M
MMLSLVLILVWLGLYPQTVMNTSAAAMTQVEHLYSLAAGASSATDAAQAAAAPAAVNLIR